MVNDKLCVGVRETHLMVRLNPEMYDTVMEKEGCSHMNFTGKEMKGLVYVDEGALTTKRKLEYWMNLALDYNKIAKAFKKRK